MELTNFEKLAIVMLCDIADASGVKESVDTEIVREAIYSGNIWALEWEYPGIFSKDVPKAIVSEVVNILEMWSFIEEASTEKFPGFDSNHDSEHASVANFMTEKLKRFERLTGRVSNGVLGLDGYRRMYEKFEAMRSGLSDRNPPALTSAEVSELIAERIHPSNR